MVKEKDSKKRFLKKPKAKTIKKISSTRTLSSFAQSSGPMVREVEPKELIEDERDLYFNKEIEKERRSLGKWLS